MPTSRPTHGVTGGKPRGGTGWVWWVVGNRWHRPYHRHTGNGAVSRHPSALAFVRGHHCTELTVQCNDGHVTIKHFAFDLSTSFFNTLTIFKVAIGISHLHFSPPPLSSTPSLTSHHLFHRTESDVAPTKAPHSLALSLGSQR